MARGDRDILERAVHTVAEQAANANDLVAEGIAMGPPLVPKGQRRPERRL
jgi:hypothetical protein